MPTGPFGDISKLDLKYLNTVNDAEIGSNIASAVQPRFAGQLGKIIAINHAQARQLSDTSIGTLYGGWYQYVKATTALARGDIVAWDVVANTGLTDYEVTHTIGATLEGYLAGIALNTVTSGNYGWIQVQGLAGVKYRATVTDKTAGNIVLQVTTTATADAIADATGTYISGGVKGLKNIIGAAYEAPVDAGVNLIVMKNFHLNW